MSAELAPTVAAVVTQALAAVAETMVAADAMPESTVVVADAATEVVDRLTVKTQRSASRELLLTQVQVLVRLVVSAVAAAVVVLERACSLDDLHLLGDLHSAGRLAEADVAEAVAAVVALTPTVAERLSAHVLHKPAAVDSVMAVHSVAAVLVVEQAALLVAVSVLELAMVVDSRADLAVACTAAACMVVLVG